MPKKIHNVNQKIIEAALAIYRQEGFEKISIRKIARNSGLAIGTVYNNFEDKNELLALVLATDIEQLKLEIMESVFGKSARDALYSLIFMFVEHMMIHSNTIINYIGTLKAAEQYIQKILLGSCKSIYDLIQQIIEKVYEEECVPKNLYFSNYIAELTLSMMQSAAKSDCGDASQRTQIIYDMIISYAKLRAFKISDMSKNNIDKDNNNSAEKIIGFNSLT